MLNGSHMDVHRICDLAVVHLLKCIFNLGPPRSFMLRAPRYLNPALFSLDYAYCLFEVSVREAALEAIPQSKRSYSSIKKVSQNRCIMVE